MDDEQLTQLREEARWAVKIDMHRWYAVIEQDGQVIAVIGTQGRDGLGRYASVQEWEQVNS